MTLDIVSLSRPVVFLGPSLTLSDARDVLDADYRPPVRKGDVYACLATGATTIAIIDGVFHSQPSVWHREILEAINEGLHLFGASSMGALRAAELAPYGMTGIGTVFEWFRDGIIDGDDEVALLFAPEALGHFALSEPLVNIRATLARAVAEECLDSVHAATLLECAKRSFYPDRSYHALLEYPEIAEWPIEAKARLELFLAERVVDLKRDDALALLRHLSAFSEETRKPQAAFPSVFSQRLTFRQIASPSASRPVREVVNDLDLTLRDEIRRRLSRKWYLMAWAREQGLLCPDPVHSAFVQDFEARHLVANRAAWLVERSVTEGEYLAWLAEEAFAGWLRSQGATAYGLDSDDGDPDAAFLADWADALGIHSPDGEPLIPWLVDADPERFGFSSQLPTRFLCELRLGQPAEYSWA